MGRGAVWVVLALAAVTGVRSWIWPPQAEHPEGSAQRPTAAEAYPVADAQAVAARFARAYLSWDEDRPDERAELLRAVLRRGADTAAGWDGKGRQEVRAVQPGAVVPGKQQQARVRVDVLIAAGPEGADGRAGKNGKGGRDDAAEPAGAHWVGLEVPVVRSGAQVVVSGAPGLVGLPTRGPVLPEAETPEVDTVLSGRTETVVEQFLREWAEGRAATVTAPGARIAPLAEGVEFAELAGWSVDSGGGERRTGTARVSWSTGGAVVEQVYRVTLTRVSSAQAQRWQVAAVRGGAL
jgi:hypothetical protein